MITKIIGKCDGVDIVFTMTANGGWQSTIPPDLKDGKYILELFATDEAGNVAYITDVLYSVDSATLDFKVLFEQKFDLMILFNQQYEIKRGWIDGREIYFG